MSTTSDCESVDERVKTSHAQSHFGAGAIGNTNRHPHPPPRTHVFENTVQDSVFSRESVRGSVLAHQGLVPSPQPTELRVGQPNDSEGRRATTSLKNLTIYEVVICLWSYLAIGVIGYLLPNPCVTDGAPQRPFVEGRRWAVSVRLCPD